MLGSTADTAHTSVLDTAYLNCGGAGNVGPEQGVVALSFWGRVGPSFDGRISSIQGIRIQFGSRFIDGETVEGLCSVAVLCKLFGQLHLCKEVVFTTLELIQQCVV